MNAYVHPVPKEFAARAMINAQTNTLWGSDPWCRQASESRALGRAGEGDCHGGYQSSTRASMLCSKYNPAAPRYSRTAGANCEAMGCPIPSFASDAS
jgi:hypothetical protein